MTSEHGTFQLVYINKYKYTACGLQIINIFMIASVLACLVIGLYEFRVFDKLLFFVQCLALVAVFMKIVDSYSHNS